MQDHSISVEDNNISPRSVRTFSRRQFIKSLAILAAGVLVSRCRSLPTPSTSDNAVPTATVRSNGSEREQKGSTDRDYSATVALTKANDYSRELVRQRMETMLDSLGGISDVIQPGARVAVKVNLTGGSFFDTPPGVTAVESYMTHPEVVRVLCELLLDAGAGKLFIVEAVFDDASYGAYGYEDIAQELNADLIDLNRFAPYSGFAKMPVGSRAFIYEEFTGNPILEEIDAFVSVSKMKCHYEAGVTHSMKNLVGMVPAHAYRLEESHWWRSGLHGRGDEVKKRLPKVIMDLNRARPVHLAVIDGIMTAEGGEVPRGTFIPVSPGVLLAGKNPVATDAVATAVMGFNPQAEAPNSPFLRGDNHLNIAASLGLGTNVLDEINVVGEKIASVTFPFKPSTSS